MYEITIIAINGDRISYPQNYAGMYRFAMDLPRTMKFYGWQVAITEQTPKIRRLRIALDYLSSAFDNNFVVRGISILNALYAKERNRIRATNEYQELDLMSLQANPWIDDMGYMDIDATGWVHISNSRDLYPREETIMFFDTLLKKSEAVYIGYDKEFNQKFIDVNAMPSGSRLRIRDGLAGTNGMCHDHLIAEGYRRCYVCGAYSTDFGYISNVSDYMCQECIQEQGVRVCEHCGDLIDTNEDHEGGYTEDGDYFFCCDRCAHNEGYPYRNDNGDFVDYDPYEDDDYDEDEDDDYGLSKYINDYHTSKREADDSLTSFFIGRLNKNQKSLLCRGVEIETEGDWSKELFDVIATLGKGKYSKDSPYYSCERDGSLGRGGFELVSPKMTTNGFYKEYLPKLKKVLQYMREHGRTSHNNGRCGLHWHFSRAYFGEDYYQQMNNITKVASFIEHFKSAFRKISRREDFDYCQFFGREITKDTNLDHYDRYHVINVRTGIPTFEFRLFRGTLDENSFIASHDICYCLTKNAKRIAWKDVWNPAKWFKGLSKIARDYIVSKGCFTDVLSAENGGNE